MSKGMAFISPNDSKRGERKGQIVPKHIKEDPDFRFGKAAYLPGNQRITEVINYEYLRDFLASNVTTKAQNNIEMQKIMEKEKDWQNKSFKLRSASVAK
jgi:hypothetical protein